MFTGLQEAGNYHSGAEHASAAGLPRQPIRNLGHAEMIWNPNGGVFLGEGASFLSSDTVAWVDVRNPTFRDGPAANGHSSIYLMKVGDVESIQQIKLPKDMCVTSIVPTTTDNIAMAVTNFGLYKIDISNPGKSVELFRDLNELRNAGNYSYDERPNDCRVTPWNTLYLSMMGEGAYRDKNPYGASLSEVTADLNVEPRKIISGLEIPNGHVFIENKDGSYTMYFNDTYRPVSAGSSEHLASTDRYIVTKSGEVRPAGTLINYREAGLKDGFPDGMALFGNHILVPMFGGSCVAAVDVRSGRLTGTFDVGAQQVTSIAVMPGTRVAIVTTGNERFTDEDWNAARITDPNAGAVFKLDLYRLRKFDSGAEGAQPFKFQL